MQFILQFDRPSSGPQIEQECWYNSQQLWDFSLFLQVSSPVGDDKWQVSFWVSHWIIRSYNLLKTTGMDAPQ